MTTSITAGGAPLTAFRRAGGLGYGVAIKTLTYDGGTQHGIGDENGNGDPADVFILTGDVIVRIIAVCTQNMVFATNAAIELGITGSQSLIIATTDLTSQALIAEEIWHDATPDKEIELLSVIKEFIITDGNNITMDTTVADVTSGVIDFYCIWTPLSTDGNVVAA